MPWLKQSGSQASSYVDAGRVDDLIVKESKKIGINNSGTKDTH